jgi:hypothetical protein
VPGDIVTMEPGGSDQHRTRAAAPGEIAIELDGRALGDVTKDPMS